LIGFGLHDSKSESKAAGEGARPTQAVITV
jgi:hypothetical protein